MELKILSKTYGELIVLIDSEDFYRIGNKKIYVSKSSSGFYAMIWQNKRNVPFHRFLFGIKESNLYIDHKNGNTLDNRKENLRICFDNRNQQNRKIGINNTSGFKGVIWNKEASKWQAQIYLKGKRIYIGIYENKIDAALAYNEAAIKYHKEFAKLNIIPEVLK